MGQFFNYKVLKNQSGQTVVEYLLLLAVIVSLGGAILSNRRFKNILAGNQGVFATMKKGMVYSYRYGREYDSTTSLDEAMSFEYTSSKHDTFMNRQSSESRFFMGVTKYP